MARYGLHELRGVLGEVPNTVGHIVGFPASLTSQYISYPDNDNDCALQGFMILKILSTMALDPILGQNP